MRSRSRERERGGGAPPFAPRRGAPHTTSHHAPSPPPPSPSPLSLSSAGTVRSWFRGNGCNVLKIAPETALKLACNDRIKRLVAADPAAITPGERFLAGAAAGAVAQGAIYPLELVRTRLAVSPPGSYAGIVDAAVQVWVREGPRAFYRGIGPSLVGILPYAGVDIAVFEMLKDKLVEASGGRPPPAAILAAGMVSSSIAQAFSYPLALCRTRLQAQGRGGVPLKYSSALDVLRQALAREGVRGLYKGIGPNLVKVAPAAGISWFVFEEVKRATGLDAGPPPPPRRAG